MSGPEPLRLVIDNKTDLSSSSDVSAANSKRLAGGTSPRLRHLRTVSAFQPFDSAKALNLGQTVSENTLSMTISSDDMSGLSRTVFPVTNFAVVPSLDMSEKAYRNGLADRMRDARIGRDVTQEQIGDWLGIGREAYRKHETRGSLPPYLFETFAALTGADVLYVLTGRKQSKRGPTAVATKRPLRKRSA